MEKVYTVAEVCKILQLHRLTVYKLLQEGRIEGVLLGKHWRITQAALERAMQPTRQSGTVQAEASV